jgi:hypothetical protein
MQNASIQNGLFLGIALIVLTMIVYFIDPTFFSAGFGMTFIGISLLVYILFMVKAGNDEKNSLGGKITFGNAIKPIFLAAFIGGTMSVLFNYLLYTVIDPTLSETLVEGMISDIENNSWMPEESKEQTIESLEGQDTTPTLLGSLGTIAGGSLVGFIISLIIAAIIKNKSADEIDLNDDLA